MTSRSCAFYAPMKPPGSARPSGDRKLARLMLECLKHAGFAPIVASDFVSRDGVGDPAAQARLRDAGAAEAERVLSRLAGDPPAFWMTYHLYYKAPDWIGPWVSAALGIPYVLVEASLAEKRAAGPWAENHRAVKHALSVADLVLQPNPGDIEAVSPALRPGARMVSLPVPIEIRSGGDERAGLRRSLSETHSLDTEAVWIACAAMMRAGDKRDSYRVMARTLAGGLPRPWHLLIAGDGAAADEIHRDFDALPTVRFLGRLEEAAVLDLFRAADIYFWPAVREAFGYATLEAQSTGLPAVIGDRPGTRALVRPGETALLRAPDDAAGFRSDLADLLENQSRLESMRTAAARHVADNHALPVVAERLRDLLGDLSGGRTA